MITDLRALEADRTLAADVCIIGSGAAGLALALELGRSTLNVIVLEGGGVTLEPESQALYEVENAGAPYIGALTGRFRTLGGTTTEWAGQAIPLTQLDLQRRPWVPHSGWPIAFDELSPYYDRALRFLQVDELNYDTDLFARFGIVPPTFDASRVRYHFSKWSPTPNFKFRYRSKLEKLANVTIVTHANVDTITLNDAGSAVTAVSARTIEGKRLRATAREFILCCGGLENARLLLANDTQQRDGIGNGHGLVGAFLQDHPAAVVGTIAAKDPDDFQRRFNMRKRRAVKYSLRCSATPNLQEQEQLLNVSAGFNFLPDEDSGFAVLKTVYHRLRKRQFSFGVVRDSVMSVLASPRLLQPLAMYAFMGRTYTPDARMELTICTEQVPRRERKVTLADSRDALGMRRLRIHWDVDDAEVRTLRRFAEILREQFESAGIAKITLFPWLSGPPAEAKTRIRDIYHHIGTTRMSAAPSEGVVDSECRVHGIGNLTVASTSVFPTGGHSNPTLTMLALCMRIADRIKRSSIYEIP